MNRFFRAGFPAALAFILVGASATIASAADTVLSQQWHLQGMQAEEMWRISTGEGMTIAVIDTGVVEVPELAGQVLAGKDFTDGAAGEHDDHGTTAAAVIAGTGEGRDGKDSARGLAPGAKILPLKVSDGSEAPAGSPLRRSMAVNDSVTQAIRYAADSEAEIISISVSAALGTGSSPDAVSYALSKGKLVFAAVGESEIAEGPVQYPAMVPGVVGVSAIGKNLKALRTSAVGPQVELSAPGEDILSACAEESGLCRSSGSAVATAVAAASAALVWAEHPGWTNYQVLRVLVNTAGGPTSGAVRNNSIGYGAVRPGAALEAPGDPGAADRYPLPDLAETPAALSDASSADRGTSAAADEGPGVAFLVSLGVCAVGLLCLAVAVPMLLADRRRTGLGLSRP